MFWSAGHNVCQLVDALQEAITVEGKPAVILAKTVKGKGVSFMGNIAGWHGKAPNREQLGTALGELGVDWSIDQRLSRQPGGRCVAVSCVFQRASRCQERGFRA